MSERVQYTCDVCGAEKRDANHWWEIAMLGPTQPLQLYRWRDRVCNGNPGRWNIFHLCGHACVLRKVDEFMSPPLPPNRQEPSTEARIQPQEIPEPLQPQWTEDGPMKGSTNE